LRRRRRARKREQGRRDRRQPEAKASAFSACSQNREAVFEDLQIGIVEARIDEAELLAGRALGEPLRRRTGLAVFGVLEGKVEV